MQAWPARERHDYDSKKYPLIFIHGLCLLPYYNDATTKMFQL
jgi:hypothetical protein